MEKEGKGSDIIRNKEQEHTSLDGLEQALVGDAHKLQAVFVDGAHKKRLIEIGVKAIVVNANIDFDERVEKIEAG